MNALCDYELEIFRECAGYKPARRWGAAVGAALAHLEGSGYIDASGEPTPRGLATLASEKSEGT